MLKDISFGLRTMARNPGVPAVAVLTLALGIGANTAMFSVLNAVLLRPLPYDHPERVVTILARIPRLNLPIAFVEYNTYDEWWRAQSRSFESMYAYTPVSGNMSSGGEPERVSGLRVNCGFLKVIGTRPALGRDFLPEEDRPGGPRVAILSDDLWKRRFGADRNVIGRPVVIDKESYTIVGVLSPSFELFHREDIFLPVAASGTYRGGGPSVGVSARLKPGVRIETAQADIDRLCEGWKQAHRYPPDWGARVWPVREFYTRDVRSSVLVLTVAVGLVLLIACANVANLLLARATARQREIAIRVALGAGRGRILRQLLTESAVLSALAAGAGLLVAWGSVRALASTDLHIPYLRTASVDGAVLLFTLGATVLTTLLFGLAPAVAAVPAGLAANLKEGGRTGEEVSGRNGFRAALVVGEVALALLLVIGAALTARSLARLYAVDPGFQPESVLVADITLPAAQTEPGRRIAFYKELLARLQAVPGVKSAGMVSHLPFSNSKSGEDIVVEGAPPARPGEQPLPFRRQVDSNYFRTLQVRLLRGRFFDQHDGEGPPVAIINERMWKRCWPGQDPIGKRFGDGRNWWTTVVGVIGDMRNTSLADEPDLEYYFPYMQAPGPSMALVIRTGLDSARAAPAIRKVIHEMEPDLPVSTMTSLSEMVRNSTMSRRFSAALLGMLAGLALVLAAVGIYGIVSYSVARRTHEFGVRMALGAERGAIAGIVLRQTLLLAGSGVLIGVGAGLGVTRLLRSLLYGVSATDPSVFAGASLFLLGVAALAAYLPARRATLVDPIVALRCE